MGKKDKLIARLKSKPKDFTFEEAETLLGYLSYERSNKGKTSGSRVLFTRKGAQSHIFLHKPHPRKELLDYQVQEIIDALKKEGLL
ncbi:type II toxin-antitoxin system HicA family toxin [Selenomonas sp.]|uniref:type II toxin-antitoxin system HicA family toxin n=1 Tax=Selenomonas sp. TaxID=2053611 RepID=UPI0025E3926D|nr:type II toxin-antitoxin system HicA family toxin [Selenomonas sp.]MCI6085527.1 type II toxin-antitoxin system HicA family toxin [Selenomonas sp.]MDY3296166.1 type II toxin-antitoxin system HicA family toxin [Selenomonas sp.]MDY4417100.1 type II toxin-antitoxin system HicA family toxin [Selenomonas sp.]